MTRRSAAHDYTRPGVYHITLHVADGLGQPLGAVVGSLSAPDGSADAPRVALSPIGRMVEHELLTAIHSHYAMVSILDYVIMPEHLHCLIAVQDKILSARGKTVPLGTVIAGFKKGCNRRYWEIAGCSGKTAAHTATPTSSAPASGSVPAGFPGRDPFPYKVPSDAKSGRQPLFAPEYCDVMPIDAAQLATQRAYIKDNPRSRLLRSSGGACTHVLRNGIDTALTVSAVRGYLRRECPPQQATPEALAAIECRLLLADGFIACDSYGNRALLKAQRLLPVVCHRKDAARFNEQKARCLNEATLGAVLISPRIAPREREIITETVNHGFPVITIHDNGFPDRYHPSQERLDLCAAGRLLLVTPWHYRYRGKNEQVSVPFCKVMNCVAQALCRTKDTWWKHLHS